jgi:predicted nucleic acid-binding protein
MDETLTLLKNRCGSQVAISFRQDLESSPTVRILWVDEENEQNAWRIFKTHKDKTYSFTDCTSFSLMKEHSIKNAFAYDRHFAQHGLNKLP